MEYLSGGDLRSSLDSRTYCKWDARCALPSLSYLTPGTFFGEAFALESRAPADNTSKVSAQRSWYLLLLAYEGCGARMHAMKHRLAASFP